MRHLSLRKYAEYLGITEATVRRARDAKKIILEENKKINPDRLKNKRWAASLMNSELAGRKRPGSIKKKKNEVEVELSEEETELLSGYDKIDISNDEIVNLEKRKLISAIREKEIRIDKAREVLIDRSYVVNVFNSLWSVQQSEFIPIANKIVPEIASILGVEDQEKISIARECLENELWKVLGSIQRSMLEFLDNDN